MVSALLSPTRIGLIEAIALACGLILAGEVARYVSWIGRNSSQTSRIVAWLVPGVMNVPPSQARAAIAAMQSRVRPAAVMPLYFGPILSMRPPADIATVLVVSAFIWCFGFVAIGMVRAQMVVRHPAFVLDYDADVFFEPDPALVV
jgi:hypothetical protein